MNVINMLNIGSFPYRRVRLTFRVSLSAYSLVRSTNEALRVRSLVSRCMSFSSILKLHKSIPSGCRVMALHLKTNYGKTDGRTDKRDVYRTITFNRSYNVLQGKSE